MPSKSLITIQYDSKKLKKQKNQTIAVVLQHIYSSSFSQLFSGLLEAFKTTGYDMIISNAGYDIKKE